MEDYYEYLDSNGVTTLYKLIKDDTVALIDSYSVTINGITTTLDTHVNNTDIHTPISDIESMVDTKISGLVNSAPETLDTLKELSDALGADPNFATTVANQIGNKANKDSVYTKEETDTLLESKANSVHSHVVNDITDFPTIPTKTSELSNDSNFVTSTELHDYATKNDLNSKQDALSEEQLSNIDSIPDKANKSDLSTVATSGSYKDLLDKPVIPEGADLSDYYNKGETDNLLNSKANTSDLAVVAKSGNYNDLNNTPAIPTKLSQLENDMGFGSGSGGVITSISWTNITDKPNFATVATSGSYNDLSNKPTIPKVYNKTLTIQKNGTNVATFTSNSNTNVTANITVPTKTSELSNDSGFITGISWDKVTNKPTLAKVATSGSYTDLRNTPTIPTKVSQLENDMGFGTGGDTSDCVHKTGNETIAGIKTFTDKIISNKELHYTDTKYDWTDTSLNTWCDAGHVVWFDKTGNRRMHELVGANGGVWRKACYINENQYFSVDSNRNISYAGISFKFNGKNVALDDNVVHTSGIETIEGTKRFTSDINRKNTALDITTTPTSEMYSRFYFTDKNDKSAAFIQYAQRPNGVDYIGLRVRDKNKTIWGVQLNTNKEFVPLGNNSYSLGSSSSKWAKIYSDDVVHTSGDENISGNKYFTQDVNVKNSDVDIAVTPSNNLFTCFRFRGKGNVTTASIQYSQRTYGVNDICFYVFDASSNSHGFRIRTDNRLEPINNNTYSLGSSSAKWANVYATTFNGNFKGSIDSSTTATTQATSDNSTKIATTAWVRTYVDSVAGSSAVGSSISAYYSNSTTLATTRTSNIGTGLFPAVYSDYINIAPTVGTIYTGSQLFSSFTPTASGTKSSHVYQTTASAKATFSGAFSSSAKYLCTTANAVKFRAFVSQGTNSDIGTASVVDNSSTKSIFIRVQ